MNLIVDVGGTNSRCALVDEHGAIRQVQLMQNDEHDELATLLESYLQGHSADPDCAAICIAAPISGDRVAMTNRSWTFSISALRDRLGLGRLEVVNDFTAQALALPRLGEADVARIGGGTPVAGGAMAVLGPGTGLGVSGLIPADGRWTPISGEGGHVTLAADNAEEERVIARLRARYGHCSAERVISGPGLRTLHETLQELDGVAVESLAPDEISRLARKGEPLAQRTLRMSFALLGSVAGNLALTVGARGGVYVGGGIVPAMLAEFEASQFRERFEAKGRFRDYVAAIPTYVVTHRTPALLGLATLCSAPPPPPASASRNST